MKNFKPSTPQIVGAILGLAAAAFIIPVIEVTSIVKRHPGIDQVLNQAFFGWFNVMTTTGKICTVIFMLCLIALMTLPIIKRSK